MSFIKDITPTGVHSGYEVAPFDKGLETLEKEGYNLISLQENAKLRKQQGKDSDISRNGNWVREGVLYLPQKGRFLVRHSPILYNAKEATDCHRKNQDFYLNGKEEQVEEALRDSVQIDRKDIPTKRFKDDPVTVFAFGDFAQEYGDFLKDAGIKEMPIWLTNMQDKPFARQVWFRDLGGRSGLYGNSRILNISYDRLRGVRYAEGVAQKTEQIYNQRQIKDVLGTIGISGDLEKRILEKLNK